MITLFEDYSPDGRDCFQQPTSNRPYPTMLEVRAHADSRRRAGGRDWGGVGGGMEVPSY